MNQRFLLPSDEGESVKEVEKHFAVPGFAHIICWYIFRLVGTARSWRQVWESN
jgi:hypothetical protein